MRPYCFGRLDSSINKDRDSCVELIALVLISNLSTMLVLERSWETEGAN